MGQTQSKSLLNKIIFSYSKLYKNYEKDFKVNDILFFNKKFLIARNAGFIDIIDDHESRNYFIPFLEKKSQYWDIKKIYTYGNIFLLANNLSMSNLKLIHFTPNLELFLLSEIKEKIINIYDEYILSEENIYYICEDGLRRLDFVNKLDYYEEMKSVNLKSSHVLFFQKDMFIPSLPIPKINHLISNYSKIKIINLESFDSIVLDLPEGYNKFYFVQGSKEFNILAVKQNGVSLITLEKNYFVINELYFNNEILNKFLLADYIYSWKLDNNKFIILFYYEYDDFNDLYFISYNQTKLISINNNFVKIQNDKLITLNDYNKLFLWNLDNFDIEDEIIVKRKKSTIWGFYSKLQNKKNEFINNFLSSLKLIDFEFYQNKLRFYFQFKNFILEVELNEDNKKLFYILNDYNKSSSDLINKSSSDLIDEKIYRNIPYKIEDSLMMLKEIDGKRYSVFREFNKIVLNYDQKELDILNLLDVAFLDNYAVVLDESAVMLIDLEFGGIHDIFQNDSVFKKILKVSENQFVLLNNENYLFSINIVDKTFKVNDMKHLINLKSDFVVWREFLIFFDNVDSLCFFDCDELYTKILPVPFKSVIFHTVDDRLFIILDEENELEVKRV